jgi:ubiquinol-cytochrome c reductase cytochrome b subunit
MLVWYQKHTQFPGPGRTEKNVVGYPLMPVYMAKAGGFFFIVFGVTAFLGAVASINPIWLYGPYTPGQISAGCNPIGIWVGLMVWYVCRLRLRLMHLATQFPGTF